VALLKHGVVHADGTPVQMLDPGKKKTHRAYLWAYCPTHLDSMRGVVYDFTLSRAGVHARTFLLKIPSCSGTFPLPDIVLKNRHEHIS
jgi:hypothetical protein